MHESGLMAATVAALQEAVLHGAGSHGAGSHDAAPYGSLPDAVRQQDSAGAPGTTPAATALAHVVLGMGPGVNRAAAESAWAVAASGTAVAGARVDWVRVDDVLVCLDCEREFSGSRLSRCPACGGNGLVVGPAAEITVLDWEAGRPAAQLEDSA